MEFAPVVLFTFNRLEHTKKTIEALKKNTLAKQSDLIIFSDGPRNKDEEQLVLKVRDYLEKVDGFKSVTLIKSDINKGLAKSVIEGVTDIINKFGKVIVLEDDLVTSKYFLEYMNNALKVYEKRDDIWSISGYTPNIQIPSYYKDNIYLVRRGASWGWATWKNRWDLNDWEIKDYLQFKKNPKLIREFNLYGNDMAPMLNDQMEGRINSWAIRWGYNQFKLNKWTVYPIKSYVVNIGNDLSGTHTPITMKYNTKLTEQLLSLSAEVCINKEICSYFKKFYDLNLLGYLAIFIKSIGFYKPARKFRNKILSYINRR